MDPLVLDENAKQRLSYLLELYKLFDGHANAAFNYFLILSGLFANAYTTSLSRPLEINRIIPVGIAILGAGASLVAYLAHVRSRDMLDTIERGLRSIEQKIFEENSGFLNACVAQRPWYYRYKYLFRVAYGTFVVAFLAMAAYAGAGYFG